MMPCAFCSYCIRVYFLARGVHRLLYFDVGGFRLRECQGELRIGPAPSQEEMGALVVAVGHRGSGLGNLFIRELQVKLSGGHRVGAELRGAPFGGLASAIGWVGVE